MQPLLAATLLALAMPSHATHGEALPELSDYLASCDRAGRAVWRHTLCAPVVIVDPADGGIVTSQPAPGPLPAVRANTAFDWMGTPWVMVLRPLPSDPAERANLLFHESFHVHQRALGFAPNANVAGHLSSWQARASIRLEWAELAQALDSTGQERMQHVRRALGFRARRLQGQPQAAADERALMRHEGLASYTGVALSGDPVRLALQELASGAGRSSLARSFAYASGPAWGLLLDDLRPDWKSALANGDDLPDLVPLSPLVSADAGAEERRIVAEEQAREAEATRRLSAALAQTADDRALRLPLSKMGMDFDPNRVGTAPDQSQLYWKITLRDAWGTVSVDGAPLRLSADYRMAFVPWPLPADARLTLSKGWRVQDAAGRAALVQEGASP